MACPHERTRRLLDLRPACATLVPMRQLQPVLWTKGVLLNPQHLQTQDRFLEDSIEFQLSTLTVFPYGFSQLAVDREALAGGAFALSSAAAAYCPTGCCSTCLRRTPAPPPRPLEACWEPDQESLDVYLAIPEYRPGGYNVSVALDRNTRYAAEVLMRRDENTGLAEKPIQVARKNFRFLVQGESLDGSAVLRIARVVRSPTGGYQLDPRFVPPLMDIAANEYLLAIARRLVEILSAKSATLAGGPAARRIRALPSSASRMSPASGCCTPSTAICLNCAISSRPGGGTLPCCIPPCCRWREHSPPSPALFILGCFRATTTRICPAALPIWTRSSGSCWRRWFQHTASHSPSGWCSR